MEQSFHVPLVFCRIRAQGSALYLALRGIIALGRPTLFYAPHPHIQRVAPRTTAPHVSPATIALPSMTTRFVLSINGLLRVRLRVVICRVPPGWFALGTERWNALFVLPIYLP